MTIGIAMLAAFLTLCLVGLIVAGTYGLVCALYDHPVILFFAMAAILFVFSTLLFYFGGSHA